MKVVDLIQMAFLNLKQRKWRTLFNLTGVVLGAMIISMTFSGTRGVAHGFKAMVEKNENVHKIFVLPYRKQEQNVPPDAIQVEGVMDAQRKEAFEKRLRRDWHAKNNPWKALDRQSLSEIRENPKVMELMPVRYLNLQVTVGDQTIPLVCESLSDYDQRLKERLIAGQLPSFRHPDRVVIGEYAAYQLGRRTPSEASQLIGQRIKIRMQAPPTNALDSLMLLANQGQGGASTLDRSRIAGVIESMLEGIDESQWDPAAIAMLRTIFGKVKSDAQKVPFERELEISGILQLPANEPVSVFRSMHGEPTCDLGMHYTFVEEMLQQTGQDAIQHGARIHVASISDLIDIDQWLTESGFQAASIADILKQVTARIAELKWGILAMGCVILMITSFSISNTMTMSVMERIPEFGIMKALGARDGQILKMMLWEGITMGLVGATLATLFSLLSSLLIQRVVQAYVSSRINYRFEEAVFEFAWYDFALTFGVAIFFCAMASWLPAYRAAKLQPIEAMRRN